MLVSCRACGKRISDRAPACPFCGAKTRPEDMASGLPVSPAQPTVAAAPAASAIAAGAMPSAARAPAAPPAPSAPRPAVEPLPAYQRGDFIGDDLQVLGVLGEGGFGIVYQVVSHRNRSSYALKTLRNELMRDDATREMFRREVQIWIELGVHPHLVRAYWVEEIHGRLWLAMEYVEPDPMSRLNSLEGYLAKRPPSLSQALTWAVEFCHGMEYARSRGIRCHRDIKPANILIGQDRRLRISDFGIAGVTVTPTVAGTASAGPGQTAAGAVFGTPTHMPPEQFESAARCDERSDVYSFGVVLFQMAAAGRLPFLPPPPPAGTEPNTYYFRALERLHRDAAPPAVDSPLAATIARALQKDPARRFASFAELRAELEARLGHGTGARVVAAPAATAPDVRELNDRGQSLAALGRDPEAVACYDEALRLDPSIAAIHNNRANALRRLGRIDEAMAGFDRAIALDAAYAAPHVNKGIALAHQERNAEALAALDRGLALDPRESAAWTTKGVVLGRLGRHQEELGCLERALEIDPRDEVAWVNKGLVLSRLGRGTEALSAFDRCLQVNPRNTKAWSGKGIDLFESGRHAEAVACYDEALRIDPQDPQCWYNKGNALTQVGRMEDAHACFAETTRRAPEFPTGWYNRGLAEYQLRRLPEAASSFGEYLRRASPDDPLRPQAEKILGWIRAGDVRVLQTHIGERVDAEGRAAPVRRPGARPPSPVPPAAAPDAPRVVVKIDDASGALPAAACAMIQRGEHMQALPLVHLWIKAEPDSALAHGAMGEILIAMGRWPDALAAFGKAASLDPKDAGHLCNKGHCLESLGRHTEALATLDAAVSLDPSMSRAWANRGNTLNSLQRYEESLASSDQAITLGLDEAGVHYNKGLTYRALKRWDDAVASLDAATSRDATLGAAWYFKGEVLKHLSRWKQAVSALDKSLDLEKTNARARAMAFFHRGECLRELKRPADAALSFRNALAIDPRYEDALRALSAMGEAAGASGLEPLSRAEEWSARAKEHAEGGRFAEAISCCDQALALSPRDTTALDNRAVCLHRLGRHDESLATHARVFELNPVRGIAWFNHGVILNELERKAEARRVMEDVLLISTSQHEFHAWAKEARDDLAAQGIVAAERTALGWLAVAVHAGSAQDWDKAHAALDKALAREPRRAALWRFKGEAHRDQKQYEDALQCFAQALQLDPADVDAHHSTGRVLMAIKRYKEAIAAYDRALAIDARDPAAWSDRGKTLGILGRVEEALDSLAKAAQLAPESAAPWQNKALAEEQLGREADALASYHRFLAVATPDDRFQIEHAKARVAVLEARLGGGAPPPIPAAPEPPAPSGDESASDDESWWETLFGDVIARVVASQAPRRPPHPAAISRARKGVAAQQAGRAAEAIDWFRRALELSGDQPHLWGLLALALEPEGRIDEAIAAWDKAVACAPHDASWLSQKGEMLKRLGRGAEARSCFMAAVDLNPAHAPAWRSLGALEIAEKNYDQAAFMFELALKVDDKSAPAWIGQGIALLELGRASEALSSLERGLELDRGNADGWFALGRLHAKIGQFARSAEAYAHGLKADGSRQGAWLSAAAVFVELRHFAEALVCCDRAAKMGPIPAEAHHIRGIALDGLGRRAEALAAYGQALAADARHVGALSRMAAASLELERFGQALDFFDRVIAAAPTSAPALFQRAVCLDKLKRAEEAARGFEEFLKHAQNEPASRIQEAKERLKAIRGDNVHRAGAAAPAARVSVGPLPEARLPDVKPTAPAADCQKRAAILLNQGQLDKALQWFDQAIAADPRQAQGWEGKADTLYRLTRYAEAAAHYAKAGGLNPGSVNVWPKLGSALEASGRYGEALAAWEKGCQAAPTNPMLWNGRGLSLFYLERYDDAMKSYDQALAIDPRFAFAKFNKAHLEEKLGRKDDALRSFQQFLALAPPQLGPQIQEARKRLSELRGA